MKREIIKSMRRKKVKLSSVLDNPSAIDGFLKEVRNEEQQPLWQNKLFVHNAQKQHKERQNLMRGYVKRWKQ